jgi:glycosyltransferase involved in cell wall biosynthesis
MNNLSQVRFTVVIPAFNAARTIESAIRSVLAQTERAFELVVVDDGSADETAERARIFESDPRVRVITQRNRGPAAARNTGIAAGSAEYVSMLDADDLWLPEYLDVMGGALDRTPEAAFAYTDAWVVEDNVKKVRRKSAMSYQRPPKSVSDARTFFLLLLERNFVYTSVTARRSALEGLGGYDERPSLVGSEDWDLWLRIAGGDGLPVRVPQMLCIHRATPDSLSSDATRMIRNVCEIYRRFLNDPGTDAEARAIAEQRLAYWTAMSRQRENPTLAWRLRGLAAATKHKLLARRKWLEQPPEAVERTLRAAGELDREVPAGS